jgi:serine/threonine protein kinase
MDMLPLVRKIEPGDVIGRCRIIRELGRGGVGTVYLATHQTLQIEVALKILSPSLAMDNPALADRFIREAQLAARIRHPNVIAVMDAAHDEASGAYFIVMEYVGGGSLSWHLRHGPLPEMKAFSIVTGIAHALVIAEENRIVHRDIKPENIMLDLRGTAKLADLGLAKQALDSRTSLTLGGSYMGTPAYMSPDQARDAKVADTRDDIYSLGASFYECLTGEPPFQGETPYNIMSEVLTKPSPQPRTTRPEVSRSADLICRKMMAKNRNLRYTDARTLLQDLQHAQTFGDAGLDRLEAASLDLESVRAREQELNYGIETSADGVYAEPDLPIRVPRSALARPGAKIPARKSDYGVFGAAALLIAFVTVATLLLAWAGPNHPFSSLEKKFTTLLHGAEKPKTHEIAANEKPKPHDVATQTASTQPAKEPVPPSTPDAHAPVVPGNELTPSPQPEVALVPPVALPVDINPTNAVPAVPANPLVPPGPTPAIAAVPDSAFAARDIAEKDLPPATIAPTGKAELLRIIGEHEKGLAAPPTWKYFFFDKGAAGNARIVTVNGGRTLKNGEDLVDFASPYQEVSVLPEDKLLVDSTQALQIAQSLVPGTTVSSSELTLLQQKNSVPMWRVTLWTTDAEGEERKLGDVTLLSENGTIISRNLKP